MIACVALFDGWHDLISVPTLPPSVLYIHNTTEMVAMLDGGNGEGKGTEKNICGVGVGPYKLHPRKLHTEHNLIFWNLAHFCLSHSMKITAF